MNTQMNTKNWTKNVTYECIWLCILSRKKIDGILWNKATKTSSYSVSCYGCFGLLMASYLALTAIVEQLAQQWLDGCDYEANNEEVDNVCLQWAAKKKWIPIRWINYITEWHILNYDFVINYPNGMNKFLFLAIQSTAVVTCTECIFFFNHLAYEARDITTLVGPCRSPDPIPDLITVIDELRFFLPLSISLLHFLFRSLVIAYSHRCRTHCEFVK